MRPDDFEERSGYQKAFAAALNELKQTLDKNELDADLSEAQDLLEDCADGLKDLTEMAQSLKDFSRLDRAPVGNFDVNSGLDKTLVIARNMIKHKANISKHYGDVPEIECSPSKINQVFLNIISNAAQAIDGSGEIVLSTERYGDDKVAVSISDTGCGIPADIIDKIRDPFFTTKDVGKGTGLGLSIVDEIIRSHGGELLVESQVGKGSKFTIVLPIKAQKKSPTAAEFEDALAELQGPESEPPQFAEAS
jgi:signal transduction histidine kinase